MLHRFTHVDYEGEFALVAVIRENGRDAVIAVARYALQDKEEPADLALAVRDDRQNLGLGTVLLGKLVDIGKERGITRYKSMMDTGNTAMKRVLAALGCRVSYANSDGVYTVTVTA
jgi:acetyltransferase